MLGKCGVCLSLCIVAILRINLLFLCTYESEMYQGDLSVNIVMTKQKVQMADKIPLYSQEMRACIFITITRYYTCKLTYWLCFWKYMEGFFLIM